MSTPKPPSEPVPPHIGHEWQALTEIEREDVKEWLVRREWDEACERGEVAKTVGPCGAVKPGTYASWVPVCTMPEGHDGDHQAKMPVAWPVQKAGGERD